MNFTYGFFLIRRLMELIRHMSSWRFGISGNDQWCLLYMYLWEVVVLFSLDDVSLFQYSTLFAHQEWRSANFLPFPKKDGRFPYINLLLVPHYLIIYLYYTRKIQEYNKSILTRNKHKRPWIFLVLIFVMCDPWGPITKILNQSQPSITSCIYIYISTL